MGTSIQTPLRYDYVILLPRLMSRGRDMFRPPRADDTSPVAADETPCAVRLAIRIPGRRFPARRELPYILAS